MQMNLCKGFHVECLPQLFTAPGSTGFVLAGLLARLPLSMTGIGLITMLSQQRGAYTLAGMVSACFALSIAVLAPRISALVDRYGQFRVLPFAAASSALSMLALLACAHWQGPDWLLLVLAAAVGSLPSMPAMVRARWTAIYSGTPQLQTAFALEGVLDDLAFIVGPPLSVGLSMLFPEAGPLAAALFLIIGVACLWCSAAPNLQSARMSAGGRLLPCARAWCARWRCSCWRRASSSA
jgi:MFS family permease